MPILVSPMNNIVFQAMNDDYIHSLPLDDLLSKLTQMESEPRPAEEVYCFNIHLDRVASGVPYAFVPTRRTAATFSLSEATTSPLRQAYVAKVNNDLRPVKLLAGEHGASVPPDFPKAVAAFVKEVRAHSPKCKIILFPWWIPGGPKATNEGRYGSFSELRRTSQSEQHLGGDHRSRLHGSPSETT
jgi:hypothetical protein